LRLGGLAGLGAETVDEPLQVLALGLFLLEGDLLLAEMLGALPLEGGVVAGVQLRAPFVQVQDVGADAVEELAVVRDQQQRAGILQQPLFQPQHGVEVQVVGGLVEQQQFRGRHQGARQVQAHPPAAGELGDGAPLRRRRKAQAVQQARGPGLGVIALQLGQVVMRARRRLEIARQHGGALGIERGPQGGVPGHDELQRRVAQGRGLLGDAGDASPRRQADLAEVPLELAPDGGEQAALAAAIAPDHAHPPAGMQAQVHPGQQQLRAAAQGEIGEGQHGGGEL
jgi:hypothetical protein